MLKAVLLELLLDFVFARACRPNAWLPFFAASLPPLLLAPEMLEILALEMPFETLNVEALLLGVLALETPVFKERDAFLLG